MAEQRSPAPDLCFFFSSHEVGEHACLSQFFHLELTDNTGQTYLLLHEAVHNGQGDGRRDLSGADPYLGVRPGGVREARAAQGNVLKFGKNAVLGEVLLFTGDLVLVEAAENDRIWDIGLNIFDAQSGLIWRGRNLLGKCPMTAREELARRAQEPGGAPRPLPRWRPAAGGRPLPTKAQMPALEALQGRPATQARPSSSSSTSSTSSSSSSGQDTATQRIQRRRPGQ